MDIPADVHRSQALAAYWSGEIRTFVDAWNTTVAAVRSSGTAIGVGPAYGGIDIAGPTLALIRQMQAVIGSETAVRRQVRRQPIDQKLDGACTPRCRP